MAKAEVISKNVNIDLEVEGGYMIPEIVDKIKDARTKKAVKKYQTLKLSTDKNMWDMACQCALMKTEEFGSDEVLASFLGMSNKATFRKMRTIAEYRVLLEELGMTMSNACELIALIPKKDDKGNAKPFNYTITLHPFVEKYKDMLGVYTQAELRELVKSYRKSEQIEDKQAEAEAEAETEAESEAETETVEEVEDFTTYMEIDKEAASKLTKDQKKELMSKIIEVVGQYIENPYDMTYFHTI